MADAPPSSLFQRERESLSGLLEIVRQNRIAVSKEEGDAREAREGVKLMGGINEGSVEEVRGSDKLSTARQPKSLSQSITFSPPLLSVCLIDFFFHSCRCPESLTEMTTQGFFGVMCEEDLVICLTG